MSVNAGREYHRWHQSVGTSLREMVAAGEAPAFVGLDDLLALSSKLSSAVKASADTAASRGQETFTVEVPFTDTEQRMLTDMGSSLLTYVQILIMRGKVDAEPSAEVKEAMAALGAAS